MALISQWWMCWSCNFCVTAEIFWVLYFPRLSEDGYWEDSREKGLLGGHGHWQRQVLVVSHPASLNSHFLHCVFASTLVLPFHFYVQFFKILLFSFYMVCNLITNIINMSSTLGCGNRIHKDDLVKKTKKSCKSHTIAISIDSLFPLLQKT